MPFIPIIIKTIIVTLFSSVGKLLVKWIMALITGPALEKILLRFIKEAAKKSNNKIDDEVVRVLESRVKQKEEEKS